MTALPALLAVLSGSLVGFTLGLIGGGGSIIATPLLLYLVGLSPTHTAIGTSAVAVAANAYVNLVGHARAGHVRWRSALIFASVGAAGALIGSSIGKAVSGDYLLFFFGLLMIAVGALMLKPKRTSGTFESALSLKSDAIVAATALAAGIAAGFFGIGGGFLIVPGLVFATGMPMINAVGSSLLAVGMFGTATALNYAWSGYVDWWVAGEFIVGGIIGGTAGMRMAVRLAPQKNMLNKVFAGLVFAVAAYVLYRSARALFLGQA